MAGQTLPDATIRTEINSQIAAESITGWTLYKDYPLEDAAYPYIFINRASDAEFMCKTFWGNNQVYHIHFWGADIDAVDATASTVLEALTDGTFAVSGFNLVGIFMADGGGCDFIPDAEAWHKVLPIRIITTGADRQ